MLSTAHDGVLHPVAMTPFPTLRQSPQGGERDKTFSERSESCTGHWTARQEDGDMAKPSSKALDLPLHCLLGGEFAGCRGTHSTELGTLLEEATPVSCGREGTLSVRKGSDFGGILGFEWVGN